MTKELFLVCSTCGKNFVIAQSQYNYQLKAGRTTFYCSRSCVGKRKDNYDHLKVIGQSNRFTTDSPRYTALKTEADMLKSSMREFIRRFRDRSKQRSQKLGEVGVTVDHLVDVWNSQKGKCYFTKVGLILPRDVNYSTSSSNFKASVDRIDNNTGYVNGNVRFVSHTVNNLRGAMDDQSAVSYTHLTLPTTSRV